MKSYIYQTIERKERTVRFIEETEEGLARLQELRKENPNTGFFITTGKLNPSIKIIK